MDYKIIDTVWYTHEENIIGVVAVVTEHHLEEEKRTWKAYIGSIRTQSCISEQIDAQRIATTGAALTERVASAIFPRITRKYKDY